MQLTVGHFSTVVYKLGEKSSSVIAVTRTIGDLIQDPIVLATTGFSYSTKKIAMQSNSDFTIGLVRPQSEKTNRGLYRAYSKIDL